MGVRTHITMRMLLKHLKWTFISKYNKRGRRSGFPATRSLLCSSFVSKLHHDTNGIEAVSSGLHLEGRVSLMYDCSRQGHTNPMVTSFLSSPPKEETKQRRKGAARSLRPEKLAGHYPTRNSLPSVAQTGAPADATGQFFSLRAPGSVQTGGELHQCWAWVVHSLNAHPLCSRMVSWGCGPTSRF